MTPHSLPCGSVAQRAFGIGGCATCEGRGSAVVLGVHLPCHCRPHTPASGMTHRAQGVRS